MVAVLSLLLVLGIFFVFGWNLWTVYKEIQSRTNTKSSSHDFGDQATSNPPFNNEAVPEKTFKNFVIIFLYAILTVLGLLAMIAVGLVKVNYH
jgi:uncharacterized membrane protein